MATKKDLLKMLDDFKDDQVVIIMDEKGGWDNVQEVKSAGACIAIVFGGGSPFSDE